MRDLALTTTAGDLIEEGVTELDALAARIRDRKQRHLISVQRDWLENGRDLIAAKDLVPHGGFEEWCRREVNYSLRTAEKLMQAVRTFEPWLKTESGSDLPRPSLVYALSAPSVPQTIRDTFAPLLIAGEQVGKKMRQAIKEHREETERAKRQVALPLEGQVCEGHEGATVESDADTAHEHTADRNRQVEARSAAVDLIVARLGDHLNELVTLVATAGSESIFSIEVQREVEARARMQAVSSDEDAEPLVSLLPPPSHTATDTPAPTVNSKYGDLSRVVTGFKDVKDRLRLDRARSRDAAIRA